MTIKELIYQDFSKVFPTIIGQGVLDLKVHFNMSFVENEKELDNIKGQVNEEERIELLKVLNIVEIVEDDYDPNVEVQIKELVEKYPNILSFRLLLIMYQSDRFIEYGFKDDKEIIDYYSFFDSLSELVHLDDFFQGSRIQTPLLMLDNPSIVVINFLKKYIDRYPTKAEFKYLVGALYHNIKDYSNSNEFLLQYEGQIISDRTFNKTTNQYIYNGDDVSLDQHILVMYSIMNNFYHLFDYDNAIKYADLLLSVHENHRVDYQFCFVDPMTTRLRIFMKIGKREEFKKDFKILVEDLGEEDIPYMNLQDIVDYKNQLK